MLAGWQGVEKANWPKEPVGCWAVCPGLAAAASRAERDLAATCCLPLQQGWCSCKNPTTGAKEVLATKVLKRLLAKGTRNEISVCKAL